MNLPRLIIADETPPGIVPPSLILIYVMKRSGVKVNVFTCGRSELDMRLLKLLLGEPIISLDTFACGNARNLKTLFQEMAKPDALNIILTPIGTRREEDFIQVSQDVIDLANTFSCAVVPVISASASTVLTARTATTVLSALESSCEGAVMGVIFASVKNPREYQLLEQDYGRGTHILSLGYIPKETERPLPSMQDLYGSATGVMQIKSAALQLISASYHIEWEILNAFGQLRKKWTSPEAYRFAPRSVKAAIVGSQALSLEGDNCGVLFRLLGCDVIDYDPWRDPFPNDAGVIYFPHSAAGVYGERLLAHEPFLYGMIQSFASDRLIFANGASAPLFGQNFIASDGKKHAALGFFNFRGKYSSIKTSGDVLRKIEARGKADSIFTRPDEKMRGYALDYVNISNPGNIVPPVWGYREVRKDVELGTSGWVNGSCFVTDLCVELWSGVETVNRWLSLSKR